MIKRTLNFPPEKDHISFHALYLNHVFLSRAKLSSSAKVVSRSRLGTSVMVKVFLFLKMCRYLDALLFVSTVTTTSVTSVTLENINKSLVAMMTCIARGLARV